VLLNPSHAGDVRERKLDLGAALFVEIELERNERHALAVHRARELVDLPPVQQKLAGAFRGVVEASTLQVFGDVGVDEPDFAAAGVGIGLCDRGLPLAQRFHFGAGQCDAGFEGLANLVVEARPAVVGDHPQLAIRFRRHDPMLRPCRGKRLSPLVPRHRR
jgi:hypothetical protein